MRATRPVPSSPLRWEGRRPHSPAAPRPNRGAARDTSASTSRSAPWWERAEERWPHQQQQQRRRRRVPTPARVPQARDAHRDAMRTARETRAARVLSHSRAARSVDDTGFEPVTSSVSRKRATAAPIVRVVELFAGLEVGTGFEPVYTDLQSVASPLGQPTVEAGHVPCTSRFIENCAPQSGRRGSNSRPQPWQGCALPTELRPHAFWPSGRGASRTLAHASDGAKFGVERRCERLQRPSEPPRDAAPRTSAEARGAPRRGRRDPGR